ncbi:MAG: PHP domain-containing protein [Bacillota bacterium]|nr:PHP domain-containing protein [Bacillota bacterium]
MRIDLHTHTTASDGSDTPAGLVRKAERLGLLAVAITDHDTVDGLEEALAAGEAASAAQAGQAAVPVAVIPGIELTTDTATCEVHVLGLYLRHPHPPLLARLDAIREERIARARAMVQKLQQLGVPLEWETVWETASTRGFIGRSQIFRAMKEQRLIPPGRGREAFDYYFSKGGAAYVPHSYLDPEEAIELILGAGGVPVLAHPGRLVAGTASGDDLVKELTEKGLMGLEVYYPTHSAGETAHFLQLAERLGLIPTGGTDYHGRFGAAGVALGSYSPPASTLPRLREAAASLRRIHGGE